MLWFPFSFTKSTSQQKICMPITKVLWLLCWDFSLFQLAERWEQPDILSLPLFPNISIAELT